MYESFYIGPDESQYFIKPLEINNAVGDELMMDFTFRTYPDSISSVTLNHSLISEKAIGNIDSIRFANDAKSFTSTHTHRLYIEEKGSRFHLRSSSEIDYGGLREFLSDTDTRITIFHMGDSTEFHPTEQLLKQRQLLFDKFIQMIEL